MYNLDNVIQSMIDNAPDTLTESDRLTRDQANALMHEWGLCETGNGNGNGNGNPFTADDLAQAWNDRLDTYLAWSHAYELLTQEGMDAMVAYVRDAFTGPEADMVIRDMVDAYYYR